VTADDFVFRTGRGGDTARWEIDVPPARVTVRRGAGAGGSDRVTLTWPDGAVRNAWIEVTVKPTPRTGLPVADVFLFGNLVGETGSRGAGLVRPGAAAAVDGHDVNAVRGAMSSRPAGPADRHDFNRDGRVNALDLVVTLRSVGRTLPLAALAPPARRPAYTRAMSLLV